MDIRECNMSDLTKIISEIEGEFLITIDLSKEDEENEQ